MWGSGRPRSRPLLDGRFPGRPFPAPDWRTRASPLAPLLQQGKQLLCFGRILSLGAIHLVPQGADPIMMPRFPVLLLRNDGRARPPIHDPSQRVQAGLVDGIQSGICHRRSQPRPASGRGRHRLKKHSARGYPAPGQGFPQESVRDEAVLCGVSKFPLRGAIPALSEPQAGSENLCEAPCKIAAARPRSTRAAAIAR